MQTTITKKGEVRIKDEDVLDSINDLIIAIRKLTQTVYKPPFANEVGMVKVTPGSSTGLLPISGSVNTTTIGGGLIDQTFMQYFQNKIMINTWHSQLITR